MNSPNTLIDSAEGFFELGMCHDAWSALDQLSPDDIVSPRVLMLRLDILIALHRLDDALALGTGACRQFPSIDGFFLKTASIFLAAAEWHKAKELFLTGPPSIRRSASYWYDLGCCHGKLGEVDQAKQCLCECINRDKGFRARALDDPAFEEVWKSL